jgi:hypothetical protein
MSSIMLIGQFEPMAGSESGEGLDEKSPEDKSLHFSGLYSSLFTLSYVVSLISLIPPISALSNR